MPPAVIDSALAAPHRLAGGREFTPGFPGIETDSASCEAQLIGAAIPLSALQLDAPRSQQEVSIWGVATKLPQLGRPRLGQRGRSRSPLLPKPRHIADLPGMISGEIVQLCAIPLDVVQLPRAVAQRHEFPASPPDRLSATPFPVQFRCRVASGTLKDGQQASAIR